MNRSIFSKIILALLFIAIPSQGLWAAEIVTPEVEVAAIPAVAETKQGRIKQMQDAMRSFQKSTTSFLNCIATGNCESEKQEKLAAEVTYWSKRLMFLLAIMGASWFVKVQAEQAAQWLKEGAIGAVKTIKEGVGPVIFEGPLGFHARFGAETNPEFVRLKKAEKRRQQQNREDLETIQREAQNAKQAATQAAEDANRAELEKLRLEREALDIARFQLAQEKNNSTAENLRQRQQTREKEAELEAKIKLFEDERKKLEAERERLEQVKIQVDQVQKNITGKIDELKALRDEAQRVIDKAEGYETFIQDQGLGQQEPQKTWTQRLLGGLLPTRTN